MLRSPSKTVSILLAPRPFDDIRTGLDLFEKWPMMSVHFWSEPVVTEERRMMDGQIDVLHFHKTLSNINYINWIRSVIVELVQ